MEYIYLVVETLHFLLSGTRARHDTRRVCGRLRTRYWTARQRAWIILGLALFGIIFQWNDCTIIGNRLLVSNALDGAISHCVLDRNENERGILFGNCKWEVQSQRRHIPGI